MLIQSLGGGFSYIYTYISCSFNHWAGLSPIYTYISCSFNHCVVVSPIYILTFHVHSITGWGLLLYIVIFLVHSITGWGFLIYILIFLIHVITEWVFLLYLSTHLHISCIEQLGGGFSLYTNSGVIRERERNVLFNDALNTFYLRLYGVRHMVKDHSDSEKGNPPHRLLLSINNKGSFICTIPQTG